MQSQPIHGAIEEIVFHELRQGVGGSSNRGGNLILDKEESKHEIAISEMMFSSSDRKTTDSSPASPDWPCAKR